MGTDELDLKGLREVAEAAAAFTQDADGERWYDCAALSKFEQAVKADAVLALFAKAEALERELVEAKAYSRQNNFDADQMAIGWNGCSDKLRSAEARATAAEAWEREALDVLEPFAKAAGLRVNQLVGKAMVTVVPPDDQVFPASVITWGHLRRAAALVGQDRQKGDGDAG